MRIARPLIAIAAVSLLTLGTFAEARTRAARLDATFAKLAEPRPPATVGLPLDKLIPGLGG